jgi:hypothetical protein
MKKFSNVMFTLALVAGALASGVASAQTSVGVSIGINQPGVYGRINIGNYPQPVLVSPQPVIIVQQPVAVVRQPIYLYVPPGHQKHWGKHCYRYNACGQPVYFVQEQWVQERYQQEHPRWDGHHHGHHGQKKHKGHKDD